MTLKVFKKEELRLHIEDSRAFYVNIKGQMFLLNKAKEELDIKQGDHAVFAYDADADKWYVAFGKMKDGFDISPRECCARTNARKRCEIYCKTIALALLGKIGGDVISATIPISKRCEEQDENGYFYFLIDTENPSRVRRA